MEMTVQIENPSNIVRKLTIKVPAKEVASRFERGLAEVQKTARLKGFRPGQAPLTVIKQFYGEDVRHRLFHTLIDESFQQAVRDKKLKAVGNPKIDTPEHKTGDGAHDHSLKDNQDLTFTATIEVLPEIEVKGYTGIALTRETASVTDDDFKKVVDQFLDSQAELNPVSGGLTLADGTQSSRPAQKGDYADIKFSGGVLIDGNLKEMDGMKGSRLIEIGSNGLIPGFEDNLIGMRRGETKTFRIPFPADYHEKDLAGKDSEFTVTVQELKEKKLPELTDEMVKELGYENIADFGKKVRESLLKNKTDEIDRKLRADLVNAIVEKNSFDVPVALVESQTRALAQDWAEELKRQGVDEKTIQQAIMSEIENLRKRALGQVRASLVLEGIATKEGIQVKPEELDGEFKTAAVSMQVEEEKLREYYQKNPARQEDFVFRLRQERTVAFLLDKAKIKSKS